MGEALEATQSKLPAVRTTGTQDLTAADVAFPRIYVGQAKSPAVEAKAAQTGDIYLANDGNDLDPIIVAPEGESVTVYLLGRPNKYLERKEDKRNNIEFGRWAIDNPDAPPPGRESGVYTVYEYPIAVPGHEDDLPVRLTLKRSGVPAARKLNTALLRQGSNPPYDLAFELSAREQFNAASQSKYQVFAVKAVDGTPEGRKVAENLYSIIASQSGGQVVESSPAEGSADNGEVPL